MYTFHHLFNPELTYFLYLTEWEVQEMEEMLEEQKVCLMQVLIIWFNILSEYRTNI